MSTQRLGEPFNFEMECTNGTAFLLQIYHTHEDLVEFPSVIVCSFNKIQCQRLDQEILLEFSIHDNSETFHRLCLLHFYSGCMNETNRRTLCEGLEPQNYSYDVEGKIKSIDLGLFVGLFFPTCSVFHKLISNFSYGQFFTNHGLFPVELDILYLVGAIFLSQLDVDNCVFPINCDKICKMFS